MARAEDTEAVEQFERFFRDYYRNEIGELAREYPSERRSLYVSYNDLYRFDAELAEQLHNRPDELLEYAEEALRRYDLPVDVSLGQAHVRVTDVEPVGIRDIRARHRGQLISVQGIVRKATDVRPKVREAAFECQRCGTLTRIPQTGGEFQEPHECGGCERQGPYRINYDQSEFVDAQKLRVQESPEGLRGGETPQNIDINIEDDVTGKVTAGDHVTVTGVLHLDQQESNNSKSAMFDVYMDGLSVEIEDEQFEEMDIDDEDKRQIVELSSDPDIYDKMVGSLAPSIYGYEREKLSIMLQLFSGVTKNLPDGSRIRGDFHILLIGDPGTGKCQKYDTKVTLADGRERELGKLVEERLDDPVPVDDGVYQPVEFEVQSVTPEGTATTRPATKVWKREAPERMYRIRTASGQELEVTPSHPLFVQRGGRMEPTEAGELHEGEFIAAPRSPPGGSASHEGGTDRVPNIAEPLRQVREALALSRSDCGLPRSTYRHFERGTRDPSRESLRAIVGAFEQRLERLRGARERLATAERDDVQAAHSELGFTELVSAEETDASKSQMGCHEHEGLVPDGGTTAAARNAVLDRIDEALDVAGDIDRLRDLADNDLRWDRIESIETVEPDYDWVYDLEVAGTHTYLSNGVVSHNSVLLQYVRNLAPRAVYTSGKGSSAAGLCVTGDTMVHAGEGFVPIRELASEHHPDPVTEETAAEASEELYTFDAGSGDIERAESSHVWRMPEKECREIETAHGKRLEASTDTPLLVCGDAGLEWRPISEVEPGDHVAVPKYGDIERSSPPVREFLEFTEEKLKPSDGSVERIRRELREEFGTLRDAAAALDLPEDFVYDSLSNRHLPIDRLERLLDAVEADIDDIDVQRAMLRHGEDVRIPDRFDDELMYLAGLVFGDGDVMVSRRGGNRGHVRISNSDESLLRGAADIIERTFDKSVDIEYQDDRVPCIRLHSATVARLFSNLGVESPKEDIELDHRLTTAEHADAFLRGLFDADGSVSARDDGGSSVQFSTTSSEFARQVQLMLESYGIRAQRRERDRRGTYELESGYEIESTSVQTHLTMYGADIDRFAEEIGFESEAKAAALESITGTPRRGERLPVGDAPLRADGKGGTYYDNVERGEDPCRARARELLAERDLGEVGTAVGEVADADLRWDEVVAASDTGRKELFDLTVPGTQNFLGNGVVTHNTAAAVRDDFGEGQQWTLEAGALVLADQGVAAIDELDKMRCVTGDTLVHLGDGRVTRIRELAREAAESGSIEQRPNGRTIRDVDADAWTMDEEGNIVSRPVTAVHEYDAPETLRRVTLSTGETLTATEDHPFFVIEDGERVEKAAAELDSEDWVYVPESIPGAASDGGVAIAGDETAGGNDPSPALGAVLGYLSGDGNVYYDRSQGTYGIRFTNSEEELLADFERACRQAFGVEPSRPPSEQRDDGVETVRLSGKKHADAVLEAGMNLETYDGKSFPEAVTAGTRETKGAFVRALADSEGAVDTRTGNLRLFSSSYQLLLGTKELLLEFGVSSQLQTRERAEGRDLHVLAITDADSLAAYERRIGFTLSRKREALEEVVASASGNRTVLDVIPGVGDLLRSRRKQLRLYQRECGIEPTTYCNFEREDAHVSSHRARRILEVFEERKQQAQEDHDTLATPCSWKQLSELRKRYHVSQSELADGISYRQPQVSQQWGEDDQLRDALQERLRSLVEEVTDTDLATFRSLVRGDVKWRQVETVEPVDADTAADRVPVLRQELADLLGCPTDEALAEARRLLATDPETDSWESLRNELDRYGVSFLELAADLSVANSTVSRWFSGVVETDRFPDVRAAAEKRIEEVREELSRLVNEVEARQKPKVYDLTVEGTHNFVANGMVVHNSEDRSALHEALEQQSYHPDTELLLADGRRVDIGEFVDERMAADPEAVVDGVDCEILPLDGVRVHSVDFEEGETTKLPVDRVSRHEAPEEFVRVSFSNGRSVTVTPEHPMFVDSGTVEARDIEPGTFVPAPRKLPNSSTAVELDDEPHLAGERDVDLPDELTENLAEALGFLVAEGHAYAGSAQEIGFSNQDERLLARMDGLMSEAFGLESTDTTNAAGTVTKRWVSTKLYRWFERNAPKVMETARDKRVPAAVLGASEEHIRRFLVGAFAGDGGVESEAMSFSTASEGLAEDYADALAKLGVASRIHHDAAEDSWKVYVMGDSTARFVERVVDPADERYEEARAFVKRSEATPRHHDVLPTSAARELRELRRLVGLGLTGRFRPHIDEGYGVQVETVERELETVRERIGTVREKLDEADSLAAVREAVGWSGRALAERIGETTSAVHYAESGGYDADRRERLTRRAHEAVREALAGAGRRADALEGRTDLRYYRVTDVERVPNEGEHATDWVYDVTVEPTNTFVSKGVALHNSISISKAGINATLKSRCALLGAANPKYGRFDEYEAIAEQIDLEPALISRFDLIFTVTDKPDPERDRELASHILNTNYAGELNTHRTQNARSDYTQEEVDSVTENVEPDIERELLRKYVAYAKRTCFPVMTEEAREAIEEFYVDLRSEGNDEDSPVPVTARKLEGLVRLAEASARVRLSDRVERDDAERVIDVVRSSLEDIGMDPETGEFDADMIETGTSKTQRDRIKNIKGIIKELEQEYDDGAPTEEVLDRAEAAGIERSKAEHQIQKLRDRGEVYEPRTDHLRTV